MKSLILRALLAVLVCTLLTSAAYSCDVELTDVRVHDCGRIGVFEVEAVNYRSDDIELLILGIVYKGLVLPIASDRKFVEVEIEAGSLESFTFTSPIPRGAVRSTLELLYVVDSQGGWHECR